jgi:hypothetical protein
MAATDVASVSDVPACVGSGDGLTDEADFLLEHSLYGHATGVKGHHRGIDSEDAEPEIPGWIGAQWRRTEASGHPLDSLYYGSGEAGCGLAAGDPGCTGMDRAMETRSSMNTGLVTPGLGENIENVGLTSADRIGWLRNKETGEAGSWTNSVKLFLNKPPR